MDQLNTLSALSLDSSQRSNGARDLARRDAAPRLSDVELAVSEIATLLFEIQELRHAPAAEGSASARSAEIDSALVRLNERMEAVAEDVKALANGGGETAALQESWRSLQSDVDNLQDELKEDKWLVVFRTVAAQALEMAESLAKVLSTCEEFIGSVRGDSNPSATTIAQFQSLFRSFQSKQKYYVPSTSRVLDVLQRGINERSTQNGEVLRRYADMRTQWTQLLARLAKVDREMSALAATLSADESGDPATPSRPAVKSPRRVSNKHTSPQLRSTPIPPVPPLPTQLPPLPALQQSTSTPTHRSSASASLRPSVMVDGAPIARAKTPSRILGEERPRWNTSLKTDGSQDKEELYLSPATNRRQSAYGTPSRPITPSGRATPTFSHRSFASSTSRRAVSGPAPFRVPDWQQSDENEPPTSIMQRAMSPTPSMTSSSSRPSRIPRPSISATPPRGLAAFRDVQTPEPQLSARAWRISGLYRSVQHRPSMSGMDSRRSSVISPSFARSRQVAAPWKPDMNDELDAQVVKAISACPVRVEVERLDGMQATQARYVFSIGSLPPTRPVMCKVVRRAVKGVQVTKLLGMVDSSWTDLEIFILDRAQAAAMA